MNTNNKKLRSGLFEDAKSTEAAYQDAIRRGYTKDEINVLMTDEAKKNFVNSKTLVEVEAGDKSMEGLAVGGALGGTVVGVLAAVVAISSTIAFPGVGLVIAGPLAAGLVGAGAGSIAGGIIGALVGSGIPEERAKIYEAGIKKGGTVLIVNSHGDADDNLLIEDWKKNRGKEIY